MLLVLLIVVTTTTASVDSTSLEYVHYYLLLVIPITHMTKTSDKVMTFVIARRGISWVLRVSSQVLVYFLKGSLPWPRPYARHQ